MTLPDAAYTHLAPDLPTCRLLNGLWQVSGAHGPIDPRAAIPAMVAYHDAGFTTWDLADHYGPAEDFVGAFRRRLAAERGAAALEQVQAFTKWVPPPERMTREVVAEAVAISRRRMGMDRLDLLQFHWWEYAHPGYLDALAYLADLRDAGQMRHLALTNFDTEHLALVVERGIRIVSNQVQYSLVDRRPAVQMAAYCQAHGIQLLTYGTLCGGLLSDRYLGQPEPGPGALNTASLRKYKQIVDAWGGWALFQELLAALKQVAERHGASIANVAVRAILDRPAVAGVIVGARLGVAEHIVDNARVFALHLTADDHALIDAVLARSRDLYQRIGDCGAEYRR
ncbi:MAG TPA: aldo/keto reductase [Chloroflexota bacterium]